MLASRTGPSAVHCQSGFISPKSGLRRSAASAILKERFWQSSTVTVRASNELFLTAVDPLIQVSHPTSAPPGTCPLSRTGPSVTQVAPTSRSCGLVQLGP